MIDNSYSTPVMYPDLPNPARQSFRIPPETFLIFLHIQKTAGMTVQRLLRRHYGPSLPIRLLRMARHKQPARRTLVEAIQATGRNDRYFAAHMSFGAHDRLPKPSTYLAFFRHPVSRLVSLYHFSHRNETAFYHRQARNRSLEEFLFESGVPETDNGQVRLVAGAHGDYNIMNDTGCPCGEEMLETAKRHIDRYFGFVGLTERFDESILLLGEKLRWRSCYYLRRNVSRSARPSLPPSLVERIEEKNSLDLELYRYIENRLERDLEHLAADLPKHVSRFRKRNALYSSIMLPIYERYDSMKAHLSGNSKRAR